MGVAQKYPVWEANRTVFVYPENWLRGFLAGPNTGRELIAMVNFPLPRFIDRNYRDDQHPATPIEQSDSREVYEKSSRSLIFLAFV